MVAKDWLRGTLTGTWAIDATDASGTYLLDVRNRNWHEAWIKMLDMDITWLPPVRESSEIVGEMVKGPTVFRGLPVVTGAGDQAASAVGSGLQPSELGLSLGTSGVLFWVLDRFSLPPHPSVHAFCHAEPHSWHWMTVTQAAGLSVRWLRDVIYSGADYASIDQEAAQVSPGSDGVLFLPYLSGERAPIRQPNARGVFFGLDSQHTRPQLARAVLEGVAYSQRHCWDTMKGNSDGMRPSRVVLTGGGSRSGLWSQLVADVLALPVLVTEDPGAAVGAAWLARNALMGDVAAYPRRTIAEREPNSLTAGEYEDVYARYRRIVAHMDLLWGSR
ncbi:FGGY-family carbohydrate kinase [Sulfobacillus harzensis]|uniref:FGGY-family carbohydrate kinase n=1 Tax=Sulfobacillus harzensis TaxID=2729629 RepID=UPI0023B18E69|nr:FGGY-family carbohydrate kinase [Sulfobacillus harzensis]